VVIQQNSRMFLMMDILMSETCWAHKKWNKIASEVKLVLYSSTTVTVSGKKKIVGTNRWRVEKNHVSFNVFYCAFCSYYHSIITEVLIINKKRKMHSVAVGCIFDGNNRRPPIMCCCGRWLDTTDSVNTEHSDGTVTERWRNGDGTVTERKRDA